ncbi:MAG: DUF899 domain-containing protein [Pseudomonadota bacterium]
MSEVTQDREVWLQARRTLLEREKAHARAGDELAAQRRKLPKLPVEDYVFDDVDGQVKLSDLFNGRSQLIVQHIMFGPDWEEGCPICSFWADGYDPMIIHMEQRDISFVAVSRAPVEKLQAYRDRMGWDFAWVSALNNQFNFDFHVSLSDADREKGTTTYNYAEVPARMEEMHGTSVFERSEDGGILHTYSTYGRGLDAMNAAYGFIDLTPRGRNEGDLPFSMAWVKRHDTY